MMTSWNDIPLLGCGIKASRIECKSTSMPPGKPCIIVIFKCLGIWKTRGMFYVTISLGKHVLEVNWSHPKSSVNLFYGITLFVVFFVYIFYEPWYCWYQYLRHWKVIESKLNNGLTLLYSVTCYFFFIHGAITELMLRRTLVCSTDVSCCVGVVRLTVYA